MFVVMVVGMVPDTRWAENKQSVELQNATCDPGFSKYRPMTIIMINDEQPYNRKAADDAANNSYWHRQAGTGDGKCQKVKAHSYEEMPSAKPNLLRREGFGGYQQLF